MCCILWCIIYFCYLGVYDVICNLGSLLPRFVFLPLEDSSYLLFTQTLQRKKEENLKDNVNSYPQMLVNKISEIFIFVY